jgi:hypothetical protein
MSVRSAPAECIDPTVHFCPQVGVPHVVGSHGGVERVRVELLHGGRAEGPGHARAQRRDGPQGRARSERTGHVGERRGSSRPELFGAGTRLDPVHIISPAKLQVWATGLSGRVVRKGAERDLLVHEHTGARAVRGGRERFLPRRRVLLEQARDPDCPGVPGCPERAREHVGRLGLEVEAGAGLAGVLDLVVPVPLRGAFHPHCLDAGTADIQVESAGSLVALSFDVPTELRIAGRYRQTVVETLAAIRDATLYGRADVTCPEYRPLIAGESVGLPCPSASMEVLHGSGIEPPGERDARADWQFDPRRDAPARIDRLGLRRNVPIPVSWHLIRDVIGDHVDHTAQRAVAVEE